MGGQRRELVELVQVDRAQDAAHLVVDGRGFQLAAVQVRLEDGAVELIAHHVQVGAGLGSGKAIDYRVVVTLDEAFVAPFLLQDLGDQVRVFTGVFAVHLLERTHHHRHQTVLGGGLEARQGHLAQYALGDGFVEDETVGFLIVGSEVLGFGPHAAGLDTVDRGSAHAGTNERIFTGQVFECATTVRGAVQVHAGAGDELIAARCGVVAQCATEIDGATRVPGGGEVRAGRIDHALRIAFTGVAHASAAVGTVDLRYAVSAQRFDVPAASTADVRQLLFHAHLRHGGGGGLVGTLLFGFKLRLRRGVGGMHLRDCQAQECQCRLGANKCSIAHL